MREQVKALLEKTSQLRPVYHLYETVLRWNVRTARRNWRYRAARADDGLPIPPTRLIVKVTGGSDIGAFLNSTYQAADSIRWILEKNGLDIAQFHALLDFGCGCGRVIRRWQALTGVEIHGVDYNPDLIEWCRANLTFAHFQVNLLEPPLAYADSSFDFIYALSVFTHLPEELQQAWMAELTRVLRPGGYLLLSLHGDYYLPQLTSAERERYHDGKWVVKYEQVAGTNLCAAFCSSAYVKQSLARGVEVIDFVPQGATGNPHQDAYLLRKPGAGSA